MGDKGETDMSRLVSPDSKKKVFQTGATDTFIVNGSNVGSIRGIRFGIGIWLFWLVLIAVR